MKNLAFSGFQFIHIIDSETIKLKDLTRSIFFTEDDIGKSKAEVVA